MKTSASEKEDGFASTKRLSNSILMRASLQSSENQLKLYKSQEFINPYQFDSRGIMANSLKVTRSSPNKKKAPSSKNVLLEKFLENRSRAADTKSKSIERDFLSK